MTTPRSDIRAPRLWKALASFRLPIALFLAFALVLNAIGLAVFDSEKHSIRRAAEGSLTAVAQLKAKAITRWVEERQGDAQALAQELSIGGDVEPWLQAGAPVDDRGQKIRRRLQSLSVYAN